MGEKGSEEFLHTCASLSAHGTLRGTPFIDDKHEVKSRAQSHTGGKQQRKIKRALPTHGDTPVEKRTLVRQPVTAAKRYLFMTDFNAGTWGKVELSRLDLVWNERKIELYP